MPCALLAYRAFVPPEMNHPHQRGVKHMYQERTASAAGGEFVREWILSATGTESEAMQQGEETRPAGAAVTEREWEELLRENAPLAYRVARSVLRNTGEAEDVAQEALLRAYRRFGRLRERAKFRGWLVRISFRLALDRLRSIKRRQQREAEWVDRMTRADAGPGGEFLRHLDVALDQLPEKQRLVLLLAAMEGHTLEEVSLLLGIPVGTVKSRLFFAKKAVAEKLRCFVNPIERR